MGVVVIDMRVFLSMWVVDLMVWVLFVVVVCLREVSIWFMFLRKICVVFIRMLW